MKRKYQIISGLGVAAGVVGSLILVQACGAAVTNEEVPPGVTDITETDVEQTEEQLAAATRWNDVMDGLGIKGKTAADRSTLINNTDMNTKLIGLHTNALYATRCSSIESIALWDVVSTALDRDGTTTLAAKVYKMKYKLKASTTTAETNARTALVVIPDTGCGTSNCPIVAYGHGGDRGLAYKDIAGTFGSQQEKHIIVAPTYPGEPLCKAGVSSGADKTACDESGVDEAPVGTSIPWDNDVDDLMGVQNCLIKFHAQANISTKMKFIGGTGTFAALPMTFLAGFSRGALVAHLAAARAGAALTAAVAAFKAGGMSGLGTYIYNKTGESGAAAAALFTTLPSCSVHVAGPAGSTMGVGRLLAEMAVKGTVEKSSLVGLPGVLQLNELIKGYRDGSGTVTKDDVINMLAKRDVPLNSPMIAASLRDWSSFNLSTGAAGAAGKMLILHGEKDKVVGVSDTKINANILLGLYFTIQGDATLKAQAPGFMTSPVIFKFPADGSATASHHGDATYHASVGYKYPDLLKSVVDSLTAAAGSDQTSTVEAAAAWGTYDGKTPGETLAAWRANSATGCAL